MLGKIRSLLNFPKQKSSRSGELAEKQALEFMLAKGFTSVDTNVHSRFGELDIIMLGKNKELVFVEVRQRSSQAFGTAAETVSIHKQRKLINAARYFLQRNPEFTKYSARFDLITIESQQNNLQWLPSAFLMESQRDY